MTSEIMRERVGDDAKNKVPVNHSGTLSKQIKNKPKIYEYLKTTCFNAKITERFQSENKKSINDLKHRIKKNQNLGFGDMYFFLPLPSLFREVN
jgi:hypothetical protein